MAYVKMLILICLLLSLLAAMAYAGEIHSNLDFTNNPVNIITMAERDAVKFMFPVRDYKQPYIKEGKEYLEFVINNKEQIFMLRGIRDKNGTKLADVTMFIEGADTPQYATLTKKIAMLLDFDRDGVQDLKINVLDFDEDLSNVTFEFAVIEKGNKPNYRPTVFVNNTNDNGPGSATKGATIMDIAKSSYGRLKGWVLNNITLSIGLVIILLILIFNRRPIERYFRRTF